ncbi:MAG: DUF4166 domain-containing protein [Chloroflexi bacterium]|nr:MAG: DUF4166 domain-containing protein [Chloroflexota bacterium]
MNRGEASLWQKEPMPLSPKTRPSPVEPIPPSFRSLLSAADWSKLPAAIQARFSRRFRAGQTVCYTTRVITTRVTRTGWLLAQAARLFGAPLPIHRGDGPAVVTVTDHPGNFGQVWTRIYHVDKGFPQTISSVKRFTGNTGLEEYIGFGLSIELVVHVENNSLIFTGNAYYLSIGPWRMKIPTFLTPGKLTVVHTEADDDAFSFEMSLEHPLFGRLLHQLAQFEDATPLNLQ